MSSSDKCISCRKEFTPRKGGKKQLYCSRKCSSRERNLRYYKTHLELKSKWNASCLKSHMKARLELIMALGGKCVSPTCAVSGGMKDPRALQIDHIHGHGCREATKINTSKYYRKVLEHPELYQLLCANCNWIKRSEKHEY